ncbi:putative mitochondrial protein, partial [Mucuna pruriens]
MFFSTKDDFDFIQQTLPIPYISSAELSFFETHNQDILQPSSSIHSQTELSPPSMFTCQSRAQEMALDHPGWQQAMIVEMQALEQSGTWELVSLPSGKKAVGCRWVFAIKVDLTAQLIVSKPGWWPKDTLKPVDNPMDPNLKLMVKHDEPYSDPERYMRLVGKFIYLTITRLDISFAVGVESQFMQAPCVDHWATVLRILRHIKKTLGQGLLYEDKGDTHISEQLLSGQSENTDGAVQFRIAAVALSGA